MQFYHLLDYCVKHLGSGNQVSLDKLEGGTINQNYCLQIDDAKYLVKRFEGNRWLPIKRDEIFSLQQRIAQHDIAAKPIHLSEKQDVYIEQWLNFDKQLSHTQEQNETVLEAQIDVLAHALHDIHSCDVQTDIIDLPKHWKVYLKSLSDPDKKWRKKVTEYSRIWSDYRARFADDFVLCHNDLQLAHVLVGQNKYIDWEYAATGCRFFDLIACILANQYSQKSANLLIMRYIELSDFHREEVLQRIRILQPMVIFTHQLWWQANEFQRQKRLIKAK